MSNPTQAPGFQDAPSQNSSGSFDDTLAKTAEDLDGIAGDTLADEQVRKALKDEERDDVW